MKTNYLKLILLSFGAILLTSCTGLLYTSLDVLRPAKVAFAKTANDLLIVNNTVNQPGEYGHKTELLYEIPKNVLINTDSMSVFCLGAFTEDLEGKDFFSSVQLMPNSVNTGKDFFKLTKLSDDQVNNLCSTNHVDVILSLDRMKVYDDLTENYLTESSTYLSTLDLKYETSWSIHYPDNPEVATVQFTDTVFWESESYYRKKAMSDLPNRNDALVDGALNIGHKTVNRFVPYWDKVDRYLFNSSNRLMKKGMDSFYVKNWKSAINSWEIQYNKTNNTRLQAQAANNISIGYEIVGDLDKALDYATKSFYSFGKMTFVDYDSFLRLSEYMKELIQRKKELEILKIQLGE